MKKTTVQFPTVLVIFGATGDLMERKIVPALVDLFLLGALPPLLSVVGFSRHEYSEREFVGYIRKLVRRHKKTIAPKKLGAFLNRFSYIRGEFGSARDYALLAKRLGNIDGEWKTCANKLFYVAAPPEHYRTIIGRLSAAKLTKPCSPEEGWTRVIVEKPFGRDRTTADEIDRLLAKLFKEEQIYRIDHYLAKEMVQNILTFRFSNALFETTWDAAAIERIVIHAHETLGVEERGAFYESVGALRDFGQNHLLQLLALVTMEQPESFTPAAVRLRRAQLLRTLPTPTPRDVAVNSVRGQYTGYRQVPGVSKNSVTETYFKVRTQLQSNRWRGVDVILESGKRLRANRKEIEVVFRHPDPCLCPPGAGHNQNKLHITVEPKEGITVEFWSKKPGFGLATEKRALQFFLRPVRGKSQYVEEYRKLLLDCISGDQTLFVSTDEIRSMWRFTDAIRAAWNKNVVPLVPYAAGDDTITKTSFPEKPAMPNDVGFVGLGKMGMHMARRLAEHGWRVTAYNRTELAALHLASEEPGIIPVRSLSAFASLGSPRVVWLMVTAGPAVDAVLFGRDGLARILKPGDIVIDGGNSFYKDSRRRAERLARLGIHFVDVGTSGGPGGARHGACLMVGGDKKVFEYIEPLLRTLSRRGSYEFFPGPGAGHFVKMIHNGIEYGMMQAIAEGFTILKKSPFRLDLRAIARLYNNGSVIESRLMAWLHEALRTHGVNLRRVSGRVGATGEGAWTVATARELSVADVVIEKSLQFRKLSQKKPSYMGKILSALREQFGGHDVRS